MLYKLAPFLIVFLIFALPIFIAYIVKIRHAEQILTFSSSQNTMGLDMYLTRTGDTYEGADEHNQLMYWRKANAIHAWFIDYASGSNGEDNCQPIDVKIEDIEKLLSLCKKVLEKKDPSLLKTKAGFFFGSTEYNESYYLDIEMTVKALEYVIMMHSEYNNHTYTYQASW